MRSKISLFNKAVYKNDLRSTWPLWTLASILGLLALPLNIFLRYSEYGRYYTPTEPFSFTVQNILTSCIGNGGICFAALVYGCITAMLLFQALFQHRSALGVHALPLTRVQLFGSHVASGVTIMLIPIAVVLAVTMPLLVALGAQNEATLLLLCGTLLGVFLWGFSFAVLCCMFTGQTLAVPVFFLIFSSLPYFIYAAWNSLCSNILFGYRPVSELEVLARRLSPGLNLITAREFSRQVNTLTETIRVEGLEWIAIYAAAGAVLFAVSLWLYQRRHLEQACETVTFPILRTLFRIGVAACSAIWSALVFSSMLNVSGVVSTILLLIPGAAVGIYASQMLIRKRLRVFSRALAGQAAGVVAALGLVVVILGMGGLGYETRVPQADQVQSMQVELSHMFGVMNVDTLTFTVTDPAQIETFCTLHANYVDAHRNTVEEDELLEEDYWKASEADPAMKVYSDYLRVTYTLSNGKTMRRGYSILFHSDNMADTTSLEYQLQQFVDDNYDVAQQILAVQETASLWASRGGQSDAEYRSCNLGSGSQAAMAILASLGEELEKMDKEERRVTFLWKDEDETAAASEDWQLTVQVWNEEEGYRMFDCASISPEKFPKTWQLLEEAPEYADAVQTTAESGY